MSSVILTRRAILGAAAIVGLAKFPTESHARTPIRLRFSSLRGLSRSSPRIFEEQPLLGRSSSRGSGNVTLRAINRTSNVSATDPKSSSGTLRLRLESPKETQARADAMNTEQDLLSIVSEVLKISLEQHDIDVPDILNSTNANVAYQFDTNEPCRSDQNALLWLGFCSKEYFFSEGASGVRKKYKLEQLACERVSSSPTRRLRLNCRMLSQGSIL